MKAAGVSWLHVLACLCLAAMSEEVLGAARFLGHVPHDNHHHHTSQDGRTYPLHDSDIKLPGRHYPKLPYTFVNRGSSHTNSRPNRMYDYDYDYYDEDDDQYLKSPQSDTTGFSVGSSVPATSPTPEPREPSPRFDRDQSRSVKVQAGKTAVLVCKVLHLGNKSVSWIRHEDLHILTVDKYKYSTDHRLSVVHDEALHEWLLKIQSVTQEDAGMYECQVSTNPLLSFIVNLQVVVPSATILNGPEIHVHRGSLINLTCVVEHTPERPLYVVWYHYNKVIDYEDVGGVVQVTHSGPKTVSQLLVKRAEPSDSGKYTCQPSNGEPAFVMLHVLYGEHPGALQTNGGSDSGMKRTEALLIALLGSFILTLHNRPC